MRKLFILSLIVLSQSAFLREVSENYICYKIDEHIVTIITPLVTIKNAKIKFSGDFLFIKTDKNDELKFYINDAKYSTFEVKELEYKQCNINDISIIYDPQGIFK